LRGHPQRHVGVERRDGAGTCVLYGLLPELCDPHLPQDLLILVELPARLEDGALYRAELLLLGGALINLMNS
jgi:hypothetical protein